MRANEAKRGVVARILVVEDNALNSNMLRRSLERRGYEIEIAINGQDALDRVDVKKPDLILMDMSLPVLDGWEATRRLKTSTQSQSIPIIALTAHAMVGDREKALVAGCDEYETKPIKIDSLLGKINALLEQ